VISIALNVTVPNYANLSIYGTTSDVEIKGIYKTLGIILSDGVCSLYHQSETTEVQTQKGNILLNIDKGQIFAHSMYGKVTNALIPEGENSFVLNTVEGDIIIKKTE
jgi:hypothetical protein